MSSNNDITGDALISKIGNIEAFERNFDVIFGKKEDRPKERKAEEWAKPEITESVDKNE